MSDEYPIVLELDPETYYWCNCGKTKNPPFCSRQNKKMKKEICHD